MKYEQNLLYQIIFNCPNYIFWKDIHCIYQGCNLNFSKLSGFNSPNEVIGKNDDEMPWGSSTGYLYKKEDHEIIHSGKSIINKEVPMRFSGQSEKIILSVSKVPLFDKDKKIIGIMGIFIDITDLRLAQEREKILLIESTEAKAKAEVEQQLRQAVMILTGSIAHDLRTPLVNIEMNGDLLIKHMNVILESYYKATEAGLINYSDLPSPRVLEHFTKIGEHIKNTVRDLQNFIDTTLKTLSKTVTHNLDDSDLSVCEMWHCLHNVLFRYPFVDNEQTLIAWDKKNFKFKGDKLLVFRIFSNLIKNSLEQIHINKRGEITITTESNESFNIIRFKDTAGGAPPEVVEKMFLGFETTKKKGTGIGLAFSKMVMESFGGSIICHSKHGEYMEFVLSFPKLID